MKVCFDLTPLSTKSRYRGIGSYVLGMAGAFKKAGALPDGIELSFLVGYGRKMHLVPMDSFFGKHEEVWGKPLPYSAYYAYKSMVLPGFFSNEQVDLYHATDPKGTPHLRGTKTVVNCYDLIPTILGYPYLPRFWPRKANAVVEKWRYRGRDHIIAISKCTRRDLQQVAQLQDDRVSVVHLGVDNEKFCPTPEPEEAKRVASEIGTDRPYFLCVGGFDPRKQVKELVEAFYECVTELDEVLVICGRPSPWQKRKLQERIARLGIQKRVIFLDFVPPAILPALYRQATAHATMSIYEGFGITIVEAFASGCPVVALRASCIPEVAGDAAFLIEPGSDEAMSMALKKIATDEKLRIELRARGLDRAVHFSWDRCAAETLKVYRSVLGTTTRKVQKCGG
ncbi:MAG: glycosyltransferase family 1 protein [Pseudomonadota bacterium]